MWLILAITLSRTHVVGGSPLDLAHGHRRGLDGREGKEGKADHLALALRRCEGDRGGGTIAVREGWHW